MGLLLNGVQSDAYSLHGTTLSGVGDTAIDRDNVESTVGRVGAENRHEFLSMAIRHLFIGPQSREILTSKSSWLGISLMKPLTARLLPVADAGVVGMLYKACKHSGVICWSQAAGTEARRERRLLEV